MTACAVADPDVSIVGTHPSPKPDTGHWKKVTLQTTYAQFVRMVRDVRSERDQVVFLSMDGFIGIHAFLGESKELEGLDRAQHVYFRYAPKSVICFGPAATARFDRWYDDIRSLANFPSAVRGRDGLSPWEVPGTKSLVGNLPI
jgi:hypothetical protein